jgi:hypothetical protein
MIETTDIKLIKKGYGNTAPKTLKFHKGQETVWLKLSFRNITQDVYNVDIDTSLGEK